MRGRLRGTQGVRAVGPAQGTKAGLAAPSALTLQTGTWATARHSPGDGFPPVRDTASDLSLLQGRQRDSVFTYPLLGGVFDSPKPSPTPSLNSKAVGLKFKGESTAGNALIPGDGPAEECYRIFPWLFLLKYVHKQHWVMQLCISAF